MDALVRQQIQPLDAPSGLEALAAQAWVLEVPRPTERRFILRPEAAELVDGLLARVARGAGALDVALGRGLRAVEKAGGPLRLGYSSLGDYARERLGLPESTSRRLARLSAGLDERPLLDAAVRAGEVSLRKAQVILGVARGADEARWVAQARDATVRALAAAVRAERGGDGGTADAGEGAEPLVPLELEISEDDRVALREALSLAGTTLGATAPPWQRLEALCQEYLASHPEPERLRLEDLDADAATAAGALEGAPRGRGSEWWDAARLALEEETERWSYLERLEPLPAPDPAGGLAPGDLQALDARLCELAAMRARWDELVGHLGLLMRSLGLWREAGFASFGHYCAERLGLSLRAVEQRIALERRLHELPPLRAALASGRVSYGKAVVVAAAADEDTVEAWIARAETTPCAALRREAESAEDAQMCARRAWKARLPARVVNLLDAALGAARLAAGRPVRDGECLGIIARHFIDTWKPSLRGRRTLAHRVLERDGGLCLAPGCTRAADHAHHLWQRAHGGPDVPWNLASLCAPHHLVAIHGGFLRVRGRAPHALEWKFAGSAPVGSGRGGGVGSG
ncbi:HNH nuclease [Anaeromyxobacter sp. K]|uniref:HNH endonuclease signature motif containing protein n=1 Tax=Anaeromyxobacter sp. (strain K) TaxID=447217 RepID=UPI00015F8380|nr:HNH endonuclease signature motif containing protein [Anaeromyxobacter sp. K]ACG73328.1 HNH nuclease [Anaeromyxobacter sp. K]